MLTGHMPAGDIHPEDYRAYSDTEYIPTTLFDRFFLWEILQLVENADKYAMQKGNLRKHSFQTTPN